MPYRNRQVRLLKLLPCPERYRQLGIAEHEVERLPDEMVFVDVSKPDVVLSDRQLAAMQLGDEAYAGSRSFRELKDTIVRLFGKPFVLPCHHDRGAVNLLVHHLLGPGVRVLGQTVSASMQNLLTSRGARFRELAPERIPDESFRGNVDIDRLERVLADEAGPSVLWLASTVELRGDPPISLANFTRAATLARSHGVPVVWHVTWLAQQAWAIQKHESHATSLAEVVRMLADQADLVCADGIKAGASSKGAFIATSSLSDLERLRSHCIVFEGMPFYGGLAGRDMACLNIGLAEALDELALDSRAAQLEVAATRLREAGLPVLTGASGIDLDLSRWGEHRPSAQLLAALLYLLGGVRIGVSASTSDAMSEELLRLYWPMRGGDPEHLDWAIRALLKLWELRVQWPSNDPPFSLAAFTLAEPLGVPFPAPYRAKVVERLPALDRLSRAAALRQAGYNMVFLEADAITIDCFTDSGTNAQSETQEAFMVQANASGALAGFVAAVGETYGFPYVLAAHQGRGAEALLSEILLSPERPIVVGNQPFVTTLGHIQRCGGRFVDVSVEAAFVIKSPNWFKGDVDLEGLEAAIQTHGPEAIAYLNLGLTVNSSGGHPMRMENLREVRRLADAHDLPIVLDATRAVENAWFIQAYEPGYAHLTVRTILREMMSLADGITVSAKKDLLVHIGGFFAMRHEGWHATASRLSERYEGLHGGLAACDLAAMSHGMQEMVDDAYLSHRIGQGAFLGARLRALEIPMVEPIGGHGVFVDAEAFLPHLKENDHPGHALAAALYLEAGIRGMRVRSTFAVEGARRGRELLRLALPRRVYHNGHLEAIAQALAAVYERREAIPGLEAEYEPAAMRSTLSRYRPKGEG